MASVEVIEIGVYFEICKYVNYGFFDSLAVFSHDAARMYLNDLNVGRIFLNWAERKTRTISNGLRIYSSSAA